MTINEHQTLTLDPTNDYIEVLKSPLKSITDAVHTDGSKKVKSLDNRVSTLYFSYSKIFYLFLMYPNMRHES